MYHSLFPDSILNLILGLGLGVGGGMLGIGGGLIAIPVLGLLYGMDQHLAQGTTLVMVTPNVLIGFLRYRQRNHIDTRAVLSMCLLATVSSYIAARFAASIHAHSLQLLFALFLILLAAYCAWQSRSKRLERASPAVLSTRLLPLLGVVSGAMSGIFTVGGGLVVVPALVTLFGFTQTQAQGMALALVVPGALAALFSYAQAGNVDWGTGISLALGGVLSVSWGVALAHKLSAVRLQLAFCAVLVGSATMMLVLK